MNTVSGCSIACRVTGSGAARVLLLHALTGGPDAADRPVASGHPALRGWWAPLFHPGAPLAEDRATVWCPNLPGSCYGTRLPEGAPDPGTREMAALLLGWIEEEDLHFDAVFGSSLGGMVALELAVQAPERFGALGVIGCAARPDAWVWGTNHVQASILRSSSLGDDEAIALARRAAMLTFRTPESIAARFESRAEVRSWLDYHGDALAARYTRRTFLAFLEALDTHDIGRDRGGVVEALRRVQAPIHVLGMDPDLLFPRPLVQDLADAAREAGCLGSLAWIHSPHGHDAFLIEWDQVKAWVGRVVDTPKRTLETT